LIRNFIFEDKYKDKNGTYAPLSIGERSEHEHGGHKMQLLRSAAKWSHGIKTECSIANAYIRVIEGSEHFCYIENQFFITATSPDGCGAVKNQIGAAIVKRVVRAFEEGRKFKMIICIPSVPAFAGDLHEDSSLGMFNPLTRFERS
jgi:phospholipase D1/2